jgi:hypothetical protein
MPVESDHDLLEVSRDDDAASDRTGVDGVVVAVQAHVVIPGQAQAGRPPRARRHWRQPHHLRAVSLPALGRSASEPAVVALIRLSEPDPELGVEVSRRGEAASGQKRCLQVAVGALHQPLGLGVARAALNDLDPQRAPEALHRLGEHRAPRPPRPDRGLVVPDQRPRDRAPPAEQLPVPSEQVRALPRRDHPRGQHPRIARDHHQHRRRPGLSGAEGHRGRREPQIALRELARPVLGSRHGVGRRIVRAQLPDPVLEHRQRPAPADPLRDYRRRHRRPLFEQLPNQWFDLVDDRALHRPLILRRLLGGQRPPHRVPPQTQRPGDRLDRHPLRPMQPTDLRPLLHPQHPFPSARGVQIHPSPRGRSYDASRAVRGPDSSCR